MAARIEEELGVHCDIVPGDRGEFTVWVDDAIVARKTLDGFPEDSTCVQAVAKALEA